MAPGSTPGPLLQCRKSKSSWKGGSESKCALLGVFQQWDGKNSGEHLECKGQYPLGMPPSWKAAGIEAFGRGGAVPSILQASDGPLLRTTTAVALVLDLKSPLFLKNTRTKSQRWGVKGKLDVLICAPARKTLCGENRQWRRLFTTMWSSSAARREQLYWRCFSKGCDSADQLTLIQLRTEREEKKNLTEDKEQ